MSLIFFFVLIQVYRQQLIQKMNYKVIKKNDDLFFKYLPQKKSKKTFDKKINKENPFGVLKNLNLG